MLAGLLLFAHGCHLDDEDHELFHPLRWVMASE
jgi:hypothetical protein